MNYAVYPDPQPSPASAPASASSAVEQFICQRIRVLVDEQGHSYQAIANALGITPEQVEWYYKNA